MREEKVSQIDVVWPRRGKHTDLHMGKLVDLFTQSENLKVS
jgi:hypothetical protein